MKRDAIAKFSKNEVTFHKKTRMWRSGFNFSSKELYVHFFKYHIVEIITSVYVFGLVLIS